MTDDNSYCLSPTPLSPLSYQVIQLILKRFTALNDVACTRARDHLLVTDVEPGSEFLDDLKILTSDE